MKKALALGLFLVTLISNAQERKLLGRVLDADTKKPIANAHIIIYMTPNGATSNAAGYFELQIMSNASTLIVTHVGYEDATLEIPKQDQFMFYLKRGSTQLRTLFLAGYPSDKEPKVRGVDSHVPDEGYRVVESGAEYPGGLDGFYYFMGNSIADASSVSASRQSEIEFTIDTTGAVRDIRVSDARIIGLDSVQAIFRRMPNWKPATQQGIAVNQTFVLPISGKKWPKQNLPEVYVYMAERIRYPYVARWQGVEGIVVARFTLANGYLTELELVEDVGTGCGDEVLRMIASVPQDLLMKLGPPFSSYLLPVTFSLGKRFKQPQRQPEEGTVVLEPLTVSYK